MKERAQRAGETDPIRAVVAWASWVAALTLCFFGVRGHIRVPDGGASLLVLAVAAAAATTATVGAVVASKTGNLTGWLLTVGGLALAAGTAAGSAGRSFGWTAYVPCGQTAMPRWAVLVSMAGPAVWAACATTAITYFPFGSLRPLRDRRRLLAAPALAWLGVGAIVAVLVARPEVDGPFGRPDLLAGCSPGTAGASGGLALLALGYLGAVAIALLRLRRVSGSDRDQLRPVAWVGAASTVMIAAAAFDESWARRFSAGAPWVTAAWIVAGVGLPMAVAVSIARFHTFGIFRLVSFMADYRLWTALWSTLTVAGVIAATWALTRATGLGRHDAAVAGVALALGAGALPIWRRLQARVNERFDQHGEDPAATIERIAAGARADEHQHERLRAPVFDLLGGFAPLVIVDGTDGMRFALATDDHEVGRHTFVHGGYDLATMRCAMEVLGEARGQRPPDRMLTGTTVLDVGANIGTSVVPLLMLYGADRGIAVEPEPRNLEILGLNLTLNGLTDRVVVLPIGLSDRDGTIELELSPDNAGDHRIRVPDIGPFEGQVARAAVAVPVRRLDTLVDSGEVDPAQLGLAWLDVQGHEGHVLSGAQALLESPVPIVTEFWPSAMDRVGGLGPFVELVTAHVRRVVDLRATQAERTVVETTAAGMAELVERYADPSTFTDLLLLR